MDLMTFRELQWGTSNKYCIPSIFRQWKNITRFWMPLNLVHSRQRRCQIYKHSPADFPSHLRVSSSTRSLNVEHALAGLSLIFNEISPKVSPHSGHENLWTNSGVFARDVTSKLDFHELFFAPNETLSFLVLILYLVRVYSRDLIVR